MRQKIICFIILLSLTQVVEAQPGKNDLGRMVAAVEKAYDTDSDSLEYLADKALPLAIKLGDIDAEIKVQRLRAIKLFLNGQSDKASKILLDLAREAEKRPETIQSAHLYYAIAQVYSTNSYQAISEKYLRKGVGIAIKFNDRIALADGYNRIGIMHERRASYDSALYYYEQALQINDRLKEPLGTAYSLENIAGIYAKRKKLNEALSYQKKALAIKKQTGRKIDLSLAYINIAETFDSLKQYDSATLYIHKALAIANEIHFKDLTKYSYQFLSHIFEIRGDYKQAFQYHRKYAELNDTIYNETKTKQLAEINAKYQTEKHEQQIKELNQRATIQNLKIRQRNIFLLIAIGLLVVGGIIVYLLYNRRKLKEQAKLQAAINKQQAITTREVLYAEERERKRIAADLHDGVGQLMSATLLNLNSFFDQRNANTDPQAERILSLVSESYDELRSISHQMMPNALLKTGLVAAINELVSKIESSKINVNFDAEGIQERLSEEVETVLYRVIQECITNVLKHASATTLNIQIIKDEDGISVAIEDNGKGFDPKALKQQGIGMKNIYSRVQLQNGTIDIDSSPGKGTLVAIHIPL